MNQASQPSAPDFALFSDLRAAIESNEYTIIAYIEDLSLIKPYVVAAHIIRNDYKMHKLNNPEWRARIGGIVAMS